MSQIRAMLFPSTRQIGSVDELASRDPVAWQKFDELYHGPVLKFCHRRGLTYDDAEEIYSQLCLRLFNWKRLSDSSRQFRPGLVMILRNLIADLYRSKGRFRHFVIRFLPRTRRCTHADVTGSSEDLEYISRNLEQIRSDLGLSEAVLTAAIAYDKAIDKSIKAYAERLGLSQHVLSKARIAISKYLNAGQAETGHDE
jgi:DNA-directed RNA polymerase specialized sigma24 family protein